MRPTTARAMPTMAMAPTAAMAAAAHHRLLDHHLRRAAIHEKRPEGSPEEEDHLHDPQRKARLQHCTGLVDVQGERVIGARAVGAERT